MTEESRRQEYQAEALLLLVVFIWAANYPLVKWGIEQIGVYLFNAVRFVVAALVVAAAFFARNSWTPIRKEDWRSLLWASFIANVVYQIAFIVGLSLTTAGNSAILLSTAPLWTLCFHAWLHKERIPGRMVLGMVISLCGVVMIVVGSGQKLEFGGTAMIGDLTSLAAAALWALNTNLQKPLVAKYPPMQVAVIMLSVGAVGLSAAAVHSFMTLDWTHVPPIHYAAAVASGALAIGAANVIWTLGVKRLGPGRTANFNNLIPILAFVLSYFTLKEAVHLIHFIGAGLTIVGVWYARKR
jgi:drug/metabolite transporter (DMT)-like permease